MKTRRTVALGIAIGFGYFLVEPVLMAQMEEASARLEAVCVLVATQQPVALEVMDEFSGTFYLASDYLESEDGNPVPYPCNVRPGVALFSLGEGFFLLDDVGLSGNAVQLDAEGHAVMTLSEQQRGLASATTGDPTPPGDEGDPDPGVTNAPTITWPVSLSDLTLIAPQDVPEVGTFFLYQDQVNGDAPVPYPQNPCPLCPLYSFEAMGIQGVYLADDTDVIWPQPDPLPDPGPEPVTYAPGSLWLEITNVSGGGGSATLILHGVVSGRSYEILSCKSPAGLCWNPQRLFVAEQDPAVITVPVISGGSAFFWARLQTNLWLDIARQSDGTASLLIHNAELVDTYDLFAIDHLNAPDWVWVLRTNPGETNCSIGSLTSDSRFFVLARTNNADGDLMSDGWEHLVSHTEQTVPDALGITCNSSNCTVLVGDTAILTVAGQGPTPLGYQWRFNSNVLSGATTASLVLTNIQLTNAGSYSATAWNIMGSAASPPVNLTVIDPNLDSDGDGLSDIYETTVSHTDPTRWDSDGDGIGDGDEIGAGGLPWRLEQARNGGAVVAYATQPTALEGGACGQVRVYLPGPAPAGGATVEYWLWGSAVLNTDFTVSPTPNAISIPAGTSSATLTVCAVNDTAYSDLDRFVNITLTNCTVCPVDRYPAQVDILEDDPPAIRVLPLPPWIREPSPTYGSNTAAFYFIREGDCSNAVRANFTVSGTAQGGIHYQAFAHAYVDFAAGVATNLLPLYPKPNNTDNLDKTVSLTLTTASGYRIDPASGSATVTIASVDTPIPEVQVVASDPDAREAGPNNGQFTFSRSNVTTNEPLRAYYHVWGTAVTGETNSIQTQDYVPLPGYVDFPAGVLSVNLPVVPINNGVLQTMRTVVVTLAQGLYHVGANNSATVYIDDPGSPSFECQIVHEGLHRSGQYGVSLPAAVRVTRYGSALNSATMDWRMNYYYSGNALTQVYPGGDVSGSRVVWAARQTVANVTFDAGWQNPSDSTLNPSLTLSNAYDHFTLTVSYHAPGDLIRVSSSSSPATVIPEGSTVSGALIFQRPYPNAYTKTFVFSVSGSAGHGLDYTIDTPYSMQVQFNPNESQVSVQVRGLVNSQRNMWRTAKVVLDQGTIQLGDPGQGSAYLRVQDPAVTDPRADTDMDNDGIFDGYELDHQAQGYDPLKSNNPYDDNDRDGLGLAEELQIGCNPGVADSPPVYPSPDPSDYVSLKASLGTSGKIAFLTDCAECHAVRMVLGTNVLTSQQSLRYQSNDLDRLVNLRRGTNYPIRLYCLPPTNVLSMTQTNLTQDVYTAKYNARIFAASGNGDYPFLSDSNHLLGSNRPVVLEWLSNSATLYLPDMAIASDVDRDGSVTFTNRADRTLTNAPFVFWVNNDCDSGNDDTADDLDPAQYPADSASSNIDGLRDLEDFARLQFRVDQLPSRLQVMTNANYRTLVYLTNLLGTPSLRLFRAAETNGGLGYLTNVSTATAQAARGALGVLADGAPLTLSSTNWFVTSTNSLLLPMIFEGINTGRCVIVFGIASNTGPVLAWSRPFYLDLKRVTDLYEHWTVGDTTATEWPQIPVYATRTADSAVLSVPRKPEDLDYILFVHGWRMEPWERRAFASTAYKRLWHLGYRGRFGLYSWPTDYTGTSFWDMTSMVNRQNYDRSEQRAWRSAWGLWRLLRDLNEQYPHRVRLIAHSMGNIVASEALRFRGLNPNRPPLVQAYIASQAASVAHAYDAVHPEVVRPEQMPGMSTPEVYAAFPRGNVTNCFFMGMTNAVQKDRLGVAQTVNFHNSVDYALNHWKCWPLNQLTKPDYGWTYDGRWWRMAEWGGAEAVMLTLTSDYPEIFAHIAQARSKAMGCSEDQTHQVRGEMGGSFDLRSNFNYQNSDYEHSAQFRSINMNRRAYWWQVLNTCSLTYNLPPL